MQQRNHKNKKSSKKKKNNDNKKQTNRKQTVEPFRPYLKKKKKSMQVEFFLRFEGLSLWLKYRQTKKGFGTIFRYRKTQIFLSITQSWGF